MIAYRFVYDSRLNPGCYPYFMRQHGQVEISQIYNAKYHLNIRSSDNFSINTIALTRNVNLSFTGEKLLACSLNITWSIIFMLVPFQCVPDAQPYHDVMHTILELYVSVCLSFTHPTTDTIENCQNVLVKLHPLYCISTLWYCW